MDIVIFVTISFSGSDGFISYVTVSLSHFEENEPKAR